MESIRDCRLCGSADFKNFSARALERDDPSGTGITVGHELYPKRISCVTLGSQRVMSCVLGYDCVFLEIHAFLK